MTPLHPSDTKQLVNQASTAVPPHTSCPPLIEQQSRQEPEKYPSNINANDLDEPIPSVFPLSINDLTSLVTLCEYIDDSDTLDAVISLHYEVLKHYNTTHPYRDTLLDNLGSVMYIRFERQGNDKDLDEAIVFHREAVTLRQDVHPDRPSLLDNLANMLWKRFQYQGSDNDLDEAIMLHREALTLLQVGHSDRPSSLNNLANALRERFEHRGSDKDLDESIVLHREALTLRPVGHPDRPSSLNNLANVLDECFEHRGSDKDLDEAIMLHREALTLRPVGHPDRPQSLNNLATALNEHFEHRGGDKHIEEAVLLHREALTLCSADHPDRHNSLNNLAKSLRKCFQHRGSDNDLDEAIMLHREALTLRPAGHPDRPRSLNNLATTLNDHFEHRGNDEDLDEAIVLHREALTLRPVGCPYRHNSLNNLANSLYNRFRHRGGDKDLDEAVVLHREALTLRPVGHPDRPSSLNNCATTLHKRFQHQGSNNDLEEAIVLNREALSLYSVGHPDRSMSLNNLANMLHECFEHWQGSDKDLDEAIALHREALTLHQVGHPHRPSSLNNLANALHERFEHRGSQTDLDEAIMLHREALALRTVGNPDRPSSLNNLANTLYLRFEHRDDDEDLIEAISLCKDALTLHPVGHPDRASSLNSLADMLDERFQNQGSDEVLNEAIMLHREALTLRPVGHPDRSRSLNSLATTLHERFEYQGSDKDLNEAIVLHREALTLRPIGHPGRSLSLSNLASTLQDRFGHRGSQEDLDDAQACARSALTLLKAHDPSFARVNKVLANIYLSFHRSGLNSVGDTDGLSAAIRHLKVAACSASSGLLYRLRGSIRWVEVADQYAHGTLLEAYTTSIQLLDAYMSVTASVSSRHHALKSFPAAFAVNPASIALQNGEVCRAVELLEQGRTLIWTQMARFRTPLDTLKEHDSHHTETLVKRFRELSSILNKYPELREGTPRIKKEAETVRYSRLVDDWNGVVGEIRKIDGFSRFILPPLFSDLQDAARDGPVVILIASESSCNAIIVVHQRSPVHVRLSTNVEKLLRLANALQSTVKRETDHGEKQTKLVEMLRELWVDVVSPVVEDLSRFAPSGSRIWWCPTLLFNFLPLHAAGEYRRGGMNLSSLYVSSYTPSLTALIRARRHNYKSQPSLFAAIGQNRPPGFSFTLESVEPELDLVHNLLPLSPTVCRFTKVTSIESTKSRVFRMLEDNHWLHFACHGTQHFAEPFKSAFLMRDEPLTLLDITQTDLSNHQYAFLSACDTAVGVPDRPDEVIHLAAALQFAGVKSVIGTFWSVEDATVGCLVKEFYTNFCGDGKMHAKRAARALHKAVQSLANDKNVPLDQRILFMHIGI